MGADCHFYTEIKTKDGWQPIFIQRTKKELEEADKTYGINSPFVKNYFVNSNSANFSKRDYHLFGILAGVRGDSEPIAEPKGMPKNTSSLVRKEVVSWGSDLHSLTYYTLEELIEYDWESEGLTYFRNDYLEKFTNLGIDFDEIRFIIGFDS